VTAELIDVVSVQNELGEGVIWDQWRQKVWWTDITQQQLYRYDPESKNLESWHTPERLCCFAPVHERDYLIAAFASGFAYYQPLNGNIKWIEKVEKNNPGTRLNDGRTDRQGRFWAGTMVEDETTATAKGALYCLDQQLTISAHIQKLSITNSLCWSPDSSILYHCDTPSQTIDQYAFDAGDGTISDKQILAKTGKDCFPDGSIVDADGMLWNAQWGGHKIVRYAPDGSVDLELAVPVSQPSCVAFGGTDLDLLIVTSAYLELTPEARRAEPNAGNLFIYKTNVQGLTEQPFKPTDDKAPASL